MTIGDLMDWFEGYPRDAEIYIQSNATGQLTYVGGFQYKHGRGDSPGEMYIADTNRPVNQE
jgi:hypothetical protein